MNWRIIITAAFALAMFAANSLLCRMALGQGEVDAASYSAIRVVSGALMLVVLGVTGRRNERRGGDWRSAFWLFLYIVPFSFAYNGLTTGTGALILFGCVQATMFTAGWRAGERMTWVQISGSIVAAGGLIHLVLPGVQAPPLLPALLMAIAGLAWGLYSVRGRGAGDPFMRTAGNFSRAVPMVLLVLVACWSQLHVEPRGAALAAASGAISSALGYVAWYAALKHLSATRAAVLQLLVPALAALSGVLVLAEPFGLRLALATLLVIGGVGLTLRKR